MSEPNVTRERMLAYLDEASKYFTSTPEEEDYETYQAIRALIREHRPEVDDAFVEKWSKEFRGFTEDYDAEILVNKMLRDAGVTVKEG